MNYLRAKNENIAKNRIFCEKISSLGKFFDIALLHLKSEKYFFSKLQSNIKKATKMKFF